MRGNLAVFVCLLAFGVGCRKEPPPSPPPVPTAALIPSTRAAAWLIRQELPSGGWTESTLTPNGPQPGITSLVLYALGPHTDAERGRKYLLTTLGTDGSLGTTGPETWDHPNYTTTLGLLAFGRGAPAAAIEYLKRAQLDEGEGWKPEDKEYGGWDYGKPLYRRAWRLDLSVTAFALEAMDQAGVPASDPVWSKARMFLSRVQNLGPDGHSRHDQDDGGFFFAPHRNKAGQVELKDGTLHFPSYGSITCDGLRSLLVAGVPKNDPRVQAAYRWIQKNYTLERNPGFPPDDPDEFARGIYYYYLYALAKVLTLYGEDILTTPDGKAHRWTDEITQKLQALQKPEGYWVNSSRAMKEHDSVIATTFALATLNVLNGTKK